MIDSTAPVAPHPRAHLRGWWCAVVLLVCAAGSWACQPQAERVEWPAGHWLIGDARALEPLVLGLVELEGTPVQRNARAWLERLEGCHAFVVHLADEATAESWFDHARCADGVEIPGVLQTLRGDAPAAFSFSLPGGRQLHGRVVIASDGRLAVDATIEPAAGTGASAVGSVASLLVQGDAAAGAPVLASEDSLIHARIRPAGGLDLASLVSQGSQADQMFHLRSELFVGALLDGSFEIAIYLPRMHQVTPPMAIAIDHTIRAGAERAMQTFVSELESTWPIHHSEQQIAGVGGACFHDLKLLPDLVPCYVVTERSILIGWNPTSIELALGQRAEPVAFASGPTLDERGGWLVHFDRFPEADARLQRLLSGAPPPRSLAGLFDSLRLDAREDEAGVRLHAEFLRHQRVGANP